MGEPVDPTMTAEAGGEERGTLALVRGQAIGRYVVLARLGDGGMGVVYTAYDPELDRKIAVKLLQPAARAKQGMTDARTRLLREAQAMARLAHPNVIAVHDVGTWENQVFVAMEFVEGETLSRWVSGKSWREIIDAYAQAGRGLAAAHGAGLVHRDFKPDNVLVAGDGRVRVLDFGLARAARDDEAQADELAQRATAMSPREDALATPLTQTSAFMGTPAYMAPEQWLGQPADARADQFSFCVALWEALHGALPFGGDTLNERRYEVVQGKLQPPPDDARAPAWVREILRHGMAVRPDDRFADMSALLAALGRDPAIARRRRLRIAAVFTLFFTVVGGLFAWRRHETRMCRGAEAKLAGVWDGPRKQAIRAAFVATGKPYANETFATVERTVDRYVSAWAAMHTEACEATRLRGEQSDELLDLRMMCLGERRAALAALADLLAKADGGAVEHAVSASGSLPAVDLCADVAALRAPVRPPSDPAARAKIEALRARLAQLRVLRDEGKPRDALAQMETVVREARATGYRPLEADALSLWGGLQTDTGDSRTAEHTFVEAALAAEAGGDDRMKARALTGVAYVLGAREERPKDAEPWERQARATLERLGGDEKTLARLEGVSGNIRQVEGKFDAALEGYRRALAIDERTLGPESDYIIINLSNIGTVLMAQGRTAEARAQYERAMALAERTLGKGHPYVAVSLNNLANVLRREGKDAEALAMLQRSLAINEQAFGDGDPNVAQDLLNIAVELRHLDRHAEALAALERALRIDEAALGPDHPTVAVILRHQAATLADKGDTERSRTLFERALGILRARFGPEHPQVATLIDQIGWAELAHKRYREAAARFEQALALREKIFGKDSPNTEGPLAGLGYARLGLKQPAAAIEPLERAMHFEERAADNPGALAECRFLLAKALWDSGRDRARAHDLAEKARDGYAKLKGHEKDLREVQDWLAGHQLSR